MSTAPLVRLSSAYVNTRSTSTDENFTSLWNTELPNFCSLPTGANVRL